MYRIIGADGKQYGPIATEVVQEWIREGRLNGESQVLPEGATEWRALAQVPELARLLPPPPSPGGSPAPVFPQHPRRTNQLAVAGMVLGILAVVSGCCCYGLPFNIAGLICSSIALAQTSRDPAAQSGRGMAIAGLVLCILSFLIAASMLIIVLSNPNLLQKIRRL